MNQAMAGLGLRVRVRFRLSFNLNTVFSNVRAYEFGGLM